MLGLHLLHCLLQVSDDILHILYAYRETNEIGGYTSLKELFVRELTMGMAGRMEHTGTSICHMGHDADKIEVVHKLDSLFPATLKTEGDNTARAVKYLLEGRPQ